MPVSALDFLIGSLILVLFLIVLPFLTIRRLSKGIGTKRNRFDILSALVAYPALFCIWSYSGDILHSIMGPGLLTFLLGPVVAFVLVAAALFVARRVVGHTHEDAVL